MKPITDYLETIPREAARGRDWSPVAHSDLLEWSGLILGAAQLLHDVAPLEEEKESNEGNGS
jgi:hypothetical protein